MQESMQIFKHAGDVATEISSEDSYQSPTSNFPTLYIFTSILQRFNHQSLANMEKTHTKSALKVLYASSSLFCLLFNALSTMFVLNINFCSFFWLQSLWRLVHNLHSRGALLLEEWWDMFYFNWLGSYKHIITKVAHEFGP